MIEKFIKGIIRDYERLSRAVEDYQGPLGITMDSFRDVLITDELVPR